MRYVRTLPSGNGRWIIVVSMASPWLSMNTPPYSNVSCVKSVVAPHSTVQ